MLCPNVWKFSPPDTCSKITTGQINKEESHLPPPLTNFYFGHLVSFVFPKNQELRNLSKLLTTDSQYYKIKKINLNELCKKEFINNFIRKGTFAALSLTQIDIDNTLCITPEGILVLTLDKKTYQESGLEGEVSKFCIDKKERYIIQLNLKDESFTTNKLHYQKINECFSRIIEKYDLILAWEPPMESICPSSIAKYFCDLGYNVQLCTPTYHFRGSANVKMPIIPKEKDASSINELVEWLGMFALNVNFRPDLIRPDVNTYECPVEDTVLMNELYYIEWTGFFPIFQIKKMFNTLMKSLPLFMDTPWVSFYVQGFYDSPVSWNLEEHKYYTNRDNAYILFVEPSGQYVLYTKAGSKKKYKN